MINFRYHIVSLMAVFLALAVGIAVGVSVGPSVEQGILDQAKQDREVVIPQLRSELSRRDALDAYRNTYDQRTGQLVLAGELTDYRVAVVVMPDAPGAVVTAVSDAVTTAGGRVVATVRVNPQALQATPSPSVAQALSGLDAVGLDESMSPATKLGWCLARAVTSKSQVTRDPYAKTVGRTLSAAGLADVREDVDDYAQLVVVVTAATVVPAPATDVTKADVELQAGIHDQGGMTDHVGVVVAGPNSEGLDGTDVGAIRTTSSVSSELSTVDVADLPSGVVTTVLAGKEQLLGRQGHYGALARTDDVVPSPLPVR